ncbi:MAG: 2-oxoacid:acceptor oxidoreductase subunit alpha [Candidatus Sumerlaeota bacterium]|nr:2-oxoacid:acceptor oxidoreductase subunit alpha [Candidatus Sumerlaeota bacterium]
MAVNTPQKPRETMEAVAVRFAGDSGDGMQMVGSLFTATSALMGNDLATLPDYPAEVRAPAGSLGGVSGFQVNFSSTDVYTPGDTVNVLVALNPAALKVNLRDLQKRGILIANSDTFNDNGLKLAQYTSNPLEDGSLADYQVQALPITRMTREAVAPTGLKGKDADRCKNFFALGLVYWLFDRDLQPTLDWLTQKFAKLPAVKEANERALKAGYYYGETAEMIQVQYTVQKARLPKGLYRKIGGNEAVALGMAVAAKRAGKTLFYGSYPITPASEILHELARLKNYGVVTFQAEDEIAAMCSVIGAAFGGAFAASGTSGPGLSLKTEALGLAVMLELPCVVVDVQRGGPSTGLPTKTEQGDLYQALFGRHGECPLPVLAPLSPSDCFHATYEAFQLAAKYMTPVIVLSDGYLANGAEPMRVPKVEELPAFDIRHPVDPTGFEPYARNADLARPWALPGTPGLAHRIGGLEKQDVTGDVSYDPENHERMCRLRAEKIAKVAESIPDQEVLGDGAGADLLVVSWGSAYGAVRTAFERARAQGLSVAHLPLRYLNPMPRNLKEIFPRYKKILVAECNLGQLRDVLQARYVRPMEGLNKIQGRPFAAAEVLAGIEKALRKA